MMTKRRHVPSAAMLCRAVFALSKRPSKGYGSGRIRLWVSFSMVVAGLGGTADASELRRVRDTEITAAVRKALAMDEGVRGHVDVGAHDGIVTLEGHVHSVRAVDRGRRIAETVKGVRSVVNGLEVRTEAREDEKLRRDVEDAFREDPAIDDANVIVSVDEGRVSLTGVVDSWAAKRICGEVAAGIRGVRELANELDVHHAGRRPDAELVAEIERRLAMDVWTDDARIRVHAEDGSVTLSGFVGSAAQKSRVKNVALLSGARSVDVEGVEVSPQKHMEMRRASAPSRVPDEVIAEAVRDALRVDPRVGDEAVTVAVEEGVVRLSGHVATLRAKVSAQRDAYNTVGVWEVKNDLRVRRFEGVEPDDVISRRVQEALLREPDVDPADINVSVREGRVVLYGAVGSAYQKEQAKDAARSVRGVVEVSGDGVTTAERRIARDDDKIARQIRDGLWWNPLVDSDAIKVSVEDGAATLTGTVSDPHERNLATAEGYEAGADIVYNRLKLMNQGESR